MRRNRIKTAAFCFTLGAALVARSSAEDVTLKYADCPAPVRKAFEAETKGAKIEAVTKETTDEGVTAYGASVMIAGRHYRISVDHDGGLLQIDLEVGDDEVKFSDCPAPVQETLRREAKDFKFDEMNKDVKYGVVVYEAVAKLGGKEYSIVVAENGTLVEKMLVVAEDEIELSHCPTAVQHAMKEHARGGQIGAVTRSTGISGHVYETELEVEGKRYSLEVTEGGGLISKAVLDDDD